MSIFKRKTASGEALLGDDRTVDIEPYAPHQNLGPVSYKEPKVMGALKGNFDTHISRFLERTNPDQYNATYADLIISKAKSQALVDLSRQRTDHIRTIERSVASLWKGDRHCYERKLQDIEEEYETRNRELKRLKAIYQKNTVLEEQEA